MQPSARPQGVPVGPQSTCHAPDRGASTMLIPLPLGLSAHGGVSVSGWDMIVGVGGWDAGGKGVG